MEIKQSIHLKSGKVISRGEPNIDQEMLDNWLGVFLEPGKEWLSIGELPSLSLFPIRAIECMRFEEIVQPLEKVD